MRCKRDLTCFHWRNDTNGVEWPIFKDLEREREVSQQKEAELVARSWLRLSLSGGFQVSVQLQFKPLNTIYRKDYCVRSSVRKLRSRQHQVWLARLTCFEPTRSQCSYFASVSLSVVLGWLIWLVSKLIWSYLPVLPVPSWKSWRRKIRFCTLP